jgi:hypothetical protein
MGFAVEDRGTGEKADEVAIVEKSIARGARMVDRRSALKPWLSLSDVIVFLCYDVSAASSMQLLLTTQIFVEFSSEESVRSYSI